MLKAKSQQIEPKRSEFMDYFLVLRRRKWTVLLCLFGILIPVIIINQLLTPIYEARALIIYEEPKDTMFALDVGQPFYNKSATINLSEQIKSRTLAEQVARTLPNDIIQSFKLPDPIPQDFSQEIFIARQLQKKLIVEGIRGSDILKIKMEADNPSHAKIIVNTYLQRLSDWSLNKKREETSNVRSFVEEQLQIYQENLNQAENELKKFKEDHKLVSLNEASSEILQRVSEAEAAYNEAKTEREALEQRKKFIDQKKTPSFSLSASPSAQKMKKRLEELEVQYSSNRVYGYSENQAEMMTLKEEISNLKQNIVQEIMNVTQRDNLVDPLSQIRSLLQESITLEVNLETIKAREHALKNILKNYDAKLQSLPEQELLLARLIRSRDVNDKIYSVLLEKLQEARITEASKVGDIQIIDSAELPISPVKPNKTRNLIMGFLLGLFAGVGLAFFLNSLDTSLKSQEDVENYMNLTVLAAIPAIEKNGTLNIKKKYKHTKVSYVGKLLFELKKGSPLYDAYSTLQLNFAFINTDNVLKSILITSAVPGEGKTLNAINTALTFSNTNAKTLLIDCDLRRPMVHKVLNYKDEPGLTNVLISKIAMDKAIQEVKGTNLHLLTCGTLPPNPSEILNTQRMRDVLAELKTRYDMIIIDTPPLITVIDTVILSKEVDGVCLVIKSGKTNFDAANKAKQILQNSGAKITGVILNDVNIKNVYGYYKDYYAYNYTNKKKRKWI
ncbi:MAG: polysaccharide biosynthesis tyrosine autokinase [bacterium]|nr:polysaccharide biosynthesis tyrosine autokinase [bacterium]